MKSNHELSLFPLCSWLRLAFSRQIFTARKRCLGKGDVLHLSVSHSVHEGCLPRRECTPLGRYPMGRHPLGRHLPRQTSPPMQTTPMGRHPRGQTLPPRQTPPRQTTPPNGQTPPRQTPPRMHSCLSDSQL